MGCFKQIQQKRNYAILSRISLAQLCDLSGNFLPADDVKNEGYDENDERKDTADEGDKTQNSTNNLKDSTYEEKVCTLFCRLRKAGGGLHLVVTKNVKNSNSDSEKAEDDTAHEETEHSAKSSKSSSDEHEINSILCLRTVYNTLEVEKTPNKKTGTTKHCDVDKPAENYIETA